MSPWVKFQKSRPLGGGCRCCTVLQSPSHTRLFVPHGLQLSRPSWGLVLFPKASHLPLKLNSRGAIPQGCYKLKFPLYFEIQEQRNPEPPRLLLLVSVWNTPCLLNKFLKIWGGGGGHLAGRSLFAEGAGNLLWLSFWKECVCQVRTRYHYEETSDLTAKD